MKDSAKLTLEESKSYAQQAWAGHRYTWTSEDVLKDFEKCSTGCVDMVAFQKWVTVFASRNSQDLKRKAASKAKKETKPTKEVKKDDKLNAARPSVKKAFVYSVLPEQVQQALDKRILQRFEAMESRIVALDQGLVEVNERVDSIEDYSMRLSERIDCERDNVRMVKAKTGEAVGLINVLNHDVHKVVAKTDQAVDKVNRLKHQVFVLTESNRDLGQQMQSVLSTVALVQEQIKLGAGVANGSTANNDTYVSISGINFDDKHEEIKQSDDGVPMPPPANINFLSPTPFGTSYSPEFTPALVGEFILPTELHPVVQEEIISISSQEIKQILNEDVEEELLDQLIELDDEEPAALISVPLVFKLTPVPRTKPNTPTMTRELKGLQMQALAVESYEKTHQRCINYGIKVSAGASQIDMEELIENRTAALSLLKLRKGLVEENNAKVASLLGKRPPVITQTKLFSKMEDIVNTKPTPTKRPKFDLDQGMAQLKEEKRDELMQKSVESHINLGTLVQIELKDQELTKKKEETQALIKEHEPVAREQQLNSLASHIDQLFQYRSSFELSILLAQLEEQKKTMSEFQTKSNLRAGIDQINKITKWLSFQNVGKLIHVRREKGLHLNAILSKISEHFLNKKMEMQE